MNLHYRSVKISRNIHRLEQVEQALNILYINKLSINPLFHAEGYKTC